MEDDSIFWETLEHEERDNGSGWFWALGIITASISIAAFLYDNVLFSILIVIAGITVGIYGKRPPGIVRVNINKKGISINEKFHPYETIDSFSIDRNMLIIEKHAFLHPLISVPMDYDPEEIENYLKNFTQKRNHKEPLPHQVMEYLGF